MQHGAARRDADTLGRQVQMQLPSRMDRLQPGGQIGGQRQNRFGAYDHASAQPRRQTGPHRDRAHHGEVVEIGDGADGGDVGMRQASQRRGLDDAGAAACLIGVAPVRMGDHRLPGVAADQHACGPIDAQPFVGALMRPHVADRRGAVGGDDFQHGLASIRRHCSSAADRLTAGERRLPCPCVLAPPCPIATLLSVAVPEQARWTLTGRLIPRPARKSARPGQIRDTVRCPYRPCRPLRDWTHVGP